MKKTLFLTNSKKLACNYNCNIGIFILFPYTILFFYCFLLFLSAINLKWKKSSIFNRIYYNFVKCIKYSTCKQQCLKQKNTRTIQKKYTEKDYPYPFPYDYYFIHNTTCPKNTYLFIYLISGCNQIDERNAVRLTWGRNTDEIVFRYIIGIGNNNCSKIFINENKKYGDMLQINIYESFANETLFSLYTMKHLIALCPYSQYFAKFDVDTFVKIEKIYTILKNVRNDSYKFWGAEKQIWKKVNANQKFKYSSPTKVANYYNSIFPKDGIDVYSGFATIFTNDIPELIYKISLNYPKLMRIDDQYISWILYKLNIKINLITSYAILPSKCTIYKNVTVIHRITSTDLISYSIYYNTH